MRRGEGLVTLGDRKFGRVSTATCRATRFSGSLAHIGYPREPKPFPKGSESPPSPRKEDLCDKLESAMSGGFSISGTQRGREEEVGAVNEKSIGESGTGVVYERAYLHSAFIGPSASPSIPQIQHIILTPPHPTPPCNNTSLTAMKGGRFATKQRNVSEERCAEDCKVAAYFCLACCLASMKIANLSVPGEHNTPDQHKRTMRRQKFVTLSV